MILPGFISKILAMLRGGVAPAIIFLSALLGFWFGLVPGFSGFHAVLLVLMLLLNVPLGFVIFWAALGRGLCFAAAPVLYYCGLWLHSNMSFVVRLLSSLPIIGLTDFNRYAVTGGFVVGPIVGAVVGLVMVGSVVKFRQTLLKLEEGSETFKKWHSKKWVYILDRVLIGKRTKDAKSLFTAKTVYIRKAGVVLVVLVAAVLVAGAVAVKNGTVKNYAVSAMTRANGAEVDLAELGISLAKGDIAVSGVQATNPSDPNNNIISIASLSANTGMYDLLLGKLVLEKMELSDVRFNEKRSSPGKVVTAEKVEKAEPFDPNKYKISAGDISKLETYIKDAKALKDKLQTIRKYLPSGAGKKETAKSQVPQKYLDYLTAQVLTAAAPRVIAKLAVLDKVQIPSEIFGNSKIEMKNLSDAPSAYGMPVIFAINSLVTKAKTDIKIDYNEPIPHVNGTFAGLDMSKVQASLSGDTGLIFEKGMASGTFRGTATKELVDLTFELNISELRAKSGGKSILGLNAEAVSKALETLNNLTTTIRVVGPVTEPRLVFNVQGLTEQFKQALVKAGQDRLAGEINKQVDKLGGTAGQQIKSVIGDPNVIQKGLGGLGGLLKGGQ